MTIKKILSEISKTLKKLMQIQQERLDIERKESESSITESLEKMFGGIDFEKEGKLRKKLVDDISKEMGIKEEINIIDLELRDDSE